MSNALYDHGRNEFLKGNLHWLTDTFKAVLVDLNDYTVDLVNHDNLDDIPLAARVATVELADKTAVAGIADAGNATFSAVTGDVSEALVIYKDTGDASTSTLVAYIDTATGLPVTPNGGDVAVAWDNGDNKIFKL